MECEYCGKEKCAGHSKYELDADAAFGYCEAEYWGICNGNKNVKNPDSIYDPESEHCKNCKLKESEEY